MGIISRIKTMFAQEKQADTEFSEIPILKTETSEKIIETRIKPIRIPTILDLGERLSAISNNLSSLREEMITKSFFNQYEDVSHEILNRLSDLSKSLNEIQNLLINTNNLTKNLSDSLSKYQPLKSNEKMSPSEMILNVLRNNKRVRYKDIVSMVPFSDPTISKHIKILLSGSKITKSNIGKAVYYELV